MSIRINHQAKTIVSALAMALLLACGPLFSTSVSAFPGWAKKAAKQSLKIDIDPRADFIELLNKIEIKYSPEGRSVMKVRRAYKILSVNGTKDFSFYRSTTPKVKLSKFRTWTLSPSGEEAKAEEEVIRYIPVDRDYTVYMDDRFAFMEYANLQIGSIIAQEFEIDDNDLGTFFSDFIIQRQQPTLEIELRAQAPKGWKMYASGVGTSDFDFKKDGQWYIWKGNNLAYQPEEPLTPGWNYLSRRIGIACYNPLIDSFAVNIKDNADSGSSLSIKGQFLGWQSVARWVENIYDPIAAPDSLARHIVDSLAELSSNKTELVTKIAEFVSNQVRYVSVSLGDGRFVPHSVKETMTNGYGDCKDKTTLTRAMLTVAGVQSVATLTSIKHPVNPYLPSPYQFDHCIVGIPLNDSLNFVPHATINNKPWLFIDPTDHVTPIGKLPAQLMGASALLANHDDSTFVQLPYSEASSWRKKTIISATIEADGSMSADVEIIEYGAYVWYGAETLKNQSILQIDRDWAEGAKSVSTNLTLTKFDYQCFADSCVVSFHLEDEKYALRIGDELICKINPFDNASQRQLTTAKREHPIWFGHATASETIVTWTLPDNAVITMSIDSLSLKSKVGETQVEFASSDSTANINTVSYRSYIETTGELLSVDEYQLAQEFDVALAKSSGGMFGIKLPKATLESEKQ